MNIIQDHDNPNDIILVHFEDYAEFPFSWNKIREWIFFVVNTEGFSLQHVNIILCSDDYLIEINKKYLNHYYYTDVITFNYSDNSDDAILGDIFLSVDRLYDQAEKYKIPFHQELCRIIVHGILHLMGYDDKSDIEKSVMTQKEDYYLNNIHI